MSEELFIELYLDEDVSVLIGEMVRARGFSTTTTLSAGNLGTTDAEQLHFAAAHGKAIVTHNRVDFEKLAADYFSKDLQHSGIIIAARRSPYELTVRLLALINETTADEMKDQIRYI